MGSYYDLHGTIILEKTEETREILQKLEELAGNDFGIGYEEEEGCILLDVEISNYGSYSWIQEIDDTIESLGPYCQSPSRLDWECDGERGQLYIAKNEEEAKKEESMCTLHQEVIPLLGKLSREEMYYLFSEVGKRLNYG